MIKIVICFVLLGFSALGYLSAQSLERQLLGTVGAYAEGSQIHLSYSGGEVATETLSGTIRLTQGFQQTKTNEITALEPENLIELEYQIFPNPTSGPLHIVLSSSENIWVHWELKNELGQSIQALSGRIQLIAQQSHSSELDLSNLPSGRYYLTIANEQQIRAFQIVKR